MSEQDRNEFIDDLVKATKIRRSYYEGLSNERLLEEWDKLELIY
ncbi:hypothetical protein [Planococcus faecalis]|nr:hypothetical protein [Planococcus faecalis]